MSGTCGNTMTVVIVSAAHSLRSCPRPCGCTHARVGRSIAVAGARYSHGNTSQLWMGAHSTYLEDRTSRDWLLLLQHIISINNLWFTGGPISWPSPRLATPHQLVPANEAALLQLLQQLLQSKQDCCCRCLLGTAASATTCRYEQTQRAACHPTSSSFDIGADIVHSCNEPWTQLSAYQERNNCFGGQETAQIQRQFHACLQLNQCKATLLLLNASCCCMSSLPAAVAAACSCWRC